MPCSTAVHNATKAINGGLLGLAIERAALSLESSAHRIESMHVRYPRAIRRGPAVAVAEVAAGIGRVVVTDASNANVAALATTRSAPLR